MPDFERKQNLNPSLYWYWRDVDKHAPDCSSISDDILKTNLKSKWHTENGKVTIPYSFSYMPKLTDIAFFGFKFSISHFSSAYTELQNNIRYSLETWSATSKDHIKFVEVNNPGPDSKGIFFYLGDFEKTLLGNTHVDFDNNGEIKRAYIFFNKREEYWQFSNSPLRFDIEALSSLLNTIPHEIGHGLGFMHLHDNPDFMTKIKNIPEGVFCSVMPYDSLIKTPVTECKKDCWPEVACVPGPLDERMLDLQFKTSCVAPESNYLVLNALESYILCTAISTVSNCLHTFLSEVGVSEPVLKPWQADLLKDSLILAALIGLHFQPQTVISYGINAYVNYLSHEKDNYLAKSLQILCEANHIFNLLYAYFQGQHLVPLMATTVAGLLGGQTGKGLGDFLGNQAAHMVNFIPKIIYDIYQKKKYRKQQTSEVEQASKVDVKPVTFQQKISETNKFFEAEDKNLSAFVFANDLRPIEAPVNAGSYCADIKKLGNKIWCTLFANNEQSDSQINRQLDLESTINSLC